MKFKRYIQRSDVAVLASGDGDFDLLATRLNEGYTVNVEVYREKPLTAVSLVRAAIRFIPKSEKLLLH